MSAIGFLGLLVIAIIVLMLLMVKAKLHPVMSLFIVALGFGIILGAFGTEGYSFMETLSLITAGFGSTLGSLGMPIMLGAILAMGVQDTGAAKSIANFFIKLFHGKNLELAPALTAYIVSIPVFGDITTILCSNIANVLGKRKHISMSTMATFTQTGLNLTHAMVPPTPGILAVSVAAGCGPGHGHFLGHCGFHYCLHPDLAGAQALVDDKEFIEPAVPEVVAEIEETNSDKVEDLLIKGEDLPGTFAAFLTILIPVILIAGSSFIIIDCCGRRSHPHVDCHLRRQGRRSEPGRDLHHVPGHVPQVRRSQEQPDSTGKDPESFREVVLNSWVARGLEVALAALLITGMGGGFSTGHQVRSRNINDLATLIQDSGVPGLLIPFLVGAIMMTAVGSMTTGGITAVGVVGPMMDILGLTPVSTVLAIGAGTMIFNHVNNSGFWVISKFFNLDLKQGLKYITVPDFVAGVICFIMICIASAVGIF